MAKQETQKEKVIALLSGIGIDNPEKVLNGSSKDAREYGKHINHAIAVGRKAANQLNSMQGRNPDSEMVEHMGVNPDDVKKKYDTVEQFGESMPCFVLADSTADQTFRLISGGHVKFRSGDTICLSTGMYSSHVKIQPTIIPSKSIFKDVYRPYRGEDLTRKTLFVWRSGGIGDLLFIRPVLMAFKDKYKDVKIIFATKENYHSMVDQWGDCIDSLHKVPFNANLLRDSDYHISYEGLIERCKEAETMDVHDLFAKHSRIEISEYNRPMKCICQNQFFDIVRGEYAVVQVGASSPIRTPWIGKMVQIIDHLTESIDVIISGSKREARDIDDVISCSKRPNRIINFAKFTGSVVDAVKLVNDSRLVVAPDSSHVHMAASQGVPCVAIYGPFPAKVRTSHYPKCISVETEPSDCCTFGGKGCFTHSYLPCYWGTKCWHNLDIDKVKQAIDNQLKEMQSCSQNI